MFSNYNINMKEDIIVIKCSYYTLAQYGLMNLTKLIQELTKYLCKILVVNDCRNAAVPSSHQLVTFINQVLRIFIELSSTSIVIND